jgi:hypothetical protein
MEALKEEVTHGKRPMLHAQRRQGDEHRWIIGSSVYSGTSEGLVDLCKELESMKQRTDENVADWERYKTIRASFYLIKSSSCHPGYLCCTCPEGIKDAVCKHALLVMEREKMIDPLPQPLEGRQKAGRKRKVGPALSVV